MAAGRKDPRPRAEADRLWAKVERRGPDECWPWLGALHTDGYGKIGVGSRSDGSRRTELTHRLAWKLTNGPIPKGLFVMHSCDNPPCCNPGHLRIGTNADNMADRHSKGRYPAPGIRKTSRPRRETKNRIRPGDGDPRHGSTNGYRNHHCRCGDCREAHRLYFIDYRARRSQA